MSYDANLTRIILNKLHIIDLQGYESMIKKPSKLRVAGLSPVFRSNLKSGDYPLRIVAFFIIHQ